MPTALTEAELEAPASKPSSCTEKKDDIISLAKKVSTLTIAVFAGAVVGGTAFGYFRASPQLSLVLGTAAYMTAFLIKFTVDIYLNRNALSVPDN